MIDQSPELIHRLELAETVSVLTGAGISAASGVPTFRGEGGLWKNYRPEELATPHAFQRDPVLVWEWYSWRRDLIRNVKPNEAHFALAAMEKIIPNFVIITQNVDNLHQDAGNKNVIELHGNIMRNKCFNCGRKLEAEIDLHNLPRCPDCHGLIRPDVVWFGESLPMRAIQDAHSCAQRSEVFLIIGTSGVVEPAASIPFIARSAGAYLAEFNLEPTPLSDICDECFHGEADKLLPDLIEILTKKKNISQ